MLNSVQMSPYSQRQNLAFGKLSGQQIKQGVVKLINEGNPNANLHWAKRISKTVVREGIALSPLLIPDGIFNDPHTKYFMAACTKALKDIAGGIIYDVKKIKPHSSELNICVDDTIANKAIKGTWNGITKGVKAIVSCL